MAPISVVPTQQLECNTGLLSAFLPLFILSKSCKYFQDNLELSDTMEFNLSFSGIYVILKEKDLEGLACF